MEEVSLRRLETFPISKIMSRVRNSKLCKGIFPLDNLLLFLQLALHYKLRLALVDQKTTIKSHLSITSRSLLHNQCSKGLHLHPLQKILRILPPFLISFSKRFKAAKVQARSL